MSNTIKTIKRWFECISDDYIRNAALQNLQNYENGKNANIEEDNLHDAILNGFAHSLSPEGEDYWIEVMERANDLIG